MICRGIWRSNPSSEALSQLAPFHVIHVVCRLLKNHLRIISIFYDGVHLVVHIVQLVSDHRYFVSDACNIVSDAYYIIPDHRYFVIDGMREVQDLCRRHQSLLLRQSV
ncbi:hypothetical protein EI94DRAFT_1741088 [Lactarius quietus]|nr:hypothetical protein EI94DRAFT_1741088 [Lactarius quietus]